MLYLAIGAIGALSVYTWTLAYAEFVRRNWLGGVGITVMGLVIAVLGVWQALYW